MLTDREKAMIDVASGVYKYAGSVDVVARDRFGLSPTRFWQVVNALLRAEDAAHCRPEPVRILEARKRTQRRLRQRIIPPA